MFLDLASRFSNFFAINWKSAIVTGFDTTVMDLVIVVIFCNCSISMVILAITFWTIQFRRQVIGLTSFCDRCFDEWSRLYSDALGSGTRIAVSRTQLQQLSQMYQQQLVALDRVRALQSVWGFGRFLLFKRR